MDPPFGLAEAADNGGGGGAEGRGHGAHGHWGPDQEHVELHGHLNGGRGVPPLPPQQRGRVRLVTGRARYMKYLDILLRLPFLFLMDAILLHDVGILSGSGNGGVNVQQGRLPAAFKGQIFGQKAAFFNSFPRTYITNFASCPAEPDLFSHQDLASMYEELYGSSPDWRALPHALDLLVALVAYLSAFGLVVMLHTSQLVNFYAYLASMVLVPLSYAVNSQVMEEVIKNGVVGESGGGDSVPGPAAVTTVGWLAGPGPLILANYVCQSLIGFCSSKLVKMHWNNNAHWLVYNVIMHSALLPSALAVYGSLDPHWLRLSVALCALPPALITLLTLVQSFNHMLHLLYLGLRNRQQVIRDFGINTFLELEWSRLHIPSLLRTFWITRLVQQLCFSLAKLAVANFDEDWKLLESAWTPPPLSVICDHSIAIAKDLITRGNETVIAVLGMTSIVSKVCHYVGSFFHHYLTVNTAAGGGGPSGGGGVGAGAAAIETDEERSVASVCAIVFFVLALQTGLTSLNPDKRLIRLYQNLCLLTTAIFHFIHNMVSPILIGLAASSVVNYKRHLRALSVCLFLTLAPLLLLVCLWKWFSMGTFLLAVTVFCVEVIIKVIVTVTVYALLLYDARIRQGTWEELDDAVYFVKAAGNTVEFLCAVLLFFNGGWILFFESGGFIRAIMMLIHAYCNIWCEAQSGWKAFVKRRSAVEKINQLPDATPDQLAGYEDVCAICYQDMEQAKNTRCQHMFHAICLRKWLYIQDTCPLCHAALVQQDKQSGGGGPQVNGGAGGGRPNGEAGGANEVIDNDRVEDDQQDVDNSDLAEDDDIGDLAIDSDVSTSDSAVTMDDDDDDSGQETETTASSSESSHKPDDQNQDQNDEEEENDETSDDDDDEEEDDSSDLFYDSMEEYRREAVRADDDDLLLLPPPPRQALQPPPRRQINRRPQAAGGAGGRQRGGVGQQQQQLRRDSGGDQGDQGRNSSNHQQPPRRQLRPRQDPNGDPISSSSSSSSSTTSGASSSSAGTVER